mgnify:FL=1
MGLGKKMNDSTLSRSLDCRISDAHALGILPSLCTPHLPVRAEKESGGAFTGLSGRHGRIR